jgi:hypothetical protein
MLKLLPKTFFQWVQDYERMQNSLFFTYFQNVVLKQSVDGFIILNISGNASPRAVPVKLTG